MLITQYHKMSHKVCHKEMKKQQSVIKTVKGVDNQRRDNKTIDERELQKNNK